MKSFLFFFPSSQFLPVKSGQIALDEPAGGLPVEAEEDRNVKFDDDWKNGSENGVGMRPGTIKSAPAQSGLIRVFQLPARAASIILGGGAPWNPPEESR